MAGLWEIVSGNAADGERLSNHLLDAAYVLHGTGDITAVNVKATLEASLGRAFTGAEETDINAIAAAMAAASTVQAKLVYMEKIKAAGIAAENGSITEAKWRSILGIA